ncbi:hypothetical protein TRL7639_01954 [Falsiruegeria litorea R37]|uniref:Sulfotransferase family protein n=1 Tax=Falsiruegeria litorea R37 TaxID=1200284 RepID=A0A1Y5SES2_9RHOB|nr:gamma-glutamyl kinase [Falsiruegeria litorea]SLN38666.1 hypothetical protein TRL7639_01954 [Falsiruegeria litorea R37]
MLVFYKERLAFLAVPKTGTTAYQSALRTRADMVIANPPELKHAPVYRYNRFFRPMFDRVCGVEMETMAVIRHPLSWLGSWYRYRRRPGMEGHQNSTHDVSFDAFVDAYLRGDRPSYANVGSQLKFLETRPNGTGITHLFKYENQPALNEFLEKRLDIELKLSRENASPEMKLSLSSNTKDKLERKLADEFELHAAAQ